MHQKVWIMNHYAADMRIGYPVTQFVQLYHTADLKQIVPLRNITDK